MEINTFSEYLKEPYSLTMAQMQQFHEEMVKKLVMIRMRENYTMIL